MHPEQLEQVIEKLQALPPERIMEVEDFIDFLHQCHAERGLVRAAMIAAEPALNVVWDNPDDAEYDQL